MSNSLMVIQPYRHAGTWVFDDEDVGLVKEPFVLGIPEMIEEAMAIAGIPGEADRIRMTFGAVPFPGALEMVRLREEAGGNWYRCEALSNREGWLCPALFEYFDEAPDKLYVQVEAIQ